MSRGDEVIVIGPPKLRSAFAYLVLHRARPVSRGELIEAIWPDEVPAEPEAVLSTLLSRLRRILGREVVIGRSAVSIELGAQARVDVEELGALVASARHALAAGDHARASRLARAAAEVPAGRLLEGLDAEWVTKERLRVDALTEDALEIAGRAALAGRCPADAAAAARLLVARARYRESAHLLLMEALAAEGNRVEALLVYERLRQMLRDELGIAPNDALRELHLALVAQRSRNRRLRERAGVRRGWCAALA